MPKMNWPAVVIQQEIVALLRDRRFSEVDLLEISSAHREACGGGWPDYVENEVYEVLYRAERSIAPWDRREVGKRRAVVARLRHGGPPGALGQFRDHQEEEPHIEFDQTWIVLAP